MKKSFEICKVKKLQSLLIEIKYNGVKFQAHHPELQGQARKIFITQRNRGRIRYKCCAICKSEEKIVAHHFDYSKPLEVIFLCQYHHNLVHRGEKVERKIFKISRNSFSENLKKFRASLQWKNRWIGIANV